MGNFTSTVEGQNFKIDENGVFLVQNQSQNTSLEF